MNPIVQAGMGRTRTAIGAAEEAVSEVERAYTVYVSDDRYRTPAALARRTGIPRKRIDKLMPAFQERWVQDTEQFRKLARPYLEARAAGLIDAAVGRLAQIIESGDDRTAVAAIKVAVDIVGAKQGTGPQVVINNAAIGLAQQGITHIDDVRRLLRAEVNGHVEAVETKSQVR
jgi:hypothetical protein